MHHNGQPGAQIFDLFDHIKVKRLLSFEFVGAVAGADRRGKRIAAGAPDELDRFLRVGQAGVSFVDGNVLLNPAEFDFRPPGKIFVEEYAKFIAHKNGKLGSAGQLDAVRASLKK